MFKQRRKKITAIMHVGALLVTDKSDLFYLTGLDLDGYWMLLTDKKTFIITSEMLTNQIGKLLPEIRIVSSNNFVDALNTLKLRNIGLNFAKVNQQILAKINKKIKTKDTGDLLASLRLIKDDVEIRDIKSSCAIASKVFNKVKKLVKPGKTEMEIAFKIEEYFAKYSVRPSFTPIVASGPNTASPHHISSTRKLRPNDTVMIDMGCVYKGYCSDLTRTFFLGKITNSQNSLYYVLKKAQNQAIKRVKEDIQIGVIDSCARGIISDAGFGKNFVHSTGHGVGIDVHEEPKVNKANKGYLKAGMVITIEPGVYLPDKFGIRIEDTILVTKKGCKNLTDSAR
ncbi:M24 family metallopeptidase [Elusimicrobiota bacterium]